MGLSFLYFCYQGLTRFQAKQEDAVKEREKRLAQKELEKQEERQKNEEKKKAQKEKQKKAVSTFTLGNGVGIVLMEDHHRAKQVGSLYFVLTPNFPDSSSIFQCGRRRV